MRITSAHVYRLGDVQELAALLELAERLGYQVERFQTNSKRSGFVIENLVWAVTPSGEASRYWYNSHDPKHSAVDTAITSFALVSLEWKCPRIFAKQLLSAITDVEAQ